MSSAALSLSLLLHWACICPFKALVLPRQCINCFLSFMQFLTQQQNSLHPCAVSSFQYTHSYFWDQLCKNCGCKFSKKTSVNMMHSIPWFLSKCTVKLAAHITVWMVLRKALILSNGSFPGSKEKILRRLCKNRKKHHGLVCSPTLIPQWDFPEPEESMTNQWGEGSVSCRGENAEFALLATFTDWLIFLLHDKRVCHPPRLGGERAGVLEK